VTNPDAQKTVCPPERDIEKNLLPNRPIFRSAYDTIPAVPGDRRNRQFIANSVEKLGCAAASKFPGNFFGSRFAVGSHFHASQSRLSGVS